MLSGVQLPYKSEAQRRKMHAMERRGEISGTTVAEFDRASKGKTLPARKKSMRTKSMRRGRR